MEYRRFGDILLVRLDPGEELLDALTKTASREAVAFASVQGIGALSELEVGLFDPEQKVFHSRRFTGYRELTAVDGTITRRDGEPYLHLHVTAADAQGTVVGGHLVRAVISATAELIIRTASAAVGRRYDPAIGLNLLAFAQEDPDAAQN